MHLFIVSEKTLPIHLSYGFVGTSKDDDFDWANFAAHPGNRQRSQSAMYADICRVHKGDEILLYLEKPNNNTLREGGRFIGIFEVTSSRVFYENNGTYLLNDLGRPLIYRLQMEPKNIYADGVTEWQAMDEMTDFKSRDDIPWSIIYRKMTGGRGCTPLLPHEGDILKRMIDLRNGGQRIHVRPIEFDRNTLNLRQSANPNIPYVGNATNYQDISVFLLHLMNNTTRKWEIQLQAYLMQELKRNVVLTRTLFPEVELGWIGNEIYAGAGMQSIDILAYSTNGLNNFVHLIELKSVPAEASAAAQVNRYIKWIKAHVPNISVHQIIPTIIAPAIDQAYNEELRIYLRGHGITHYRNIVVDNALNFTQTIHAV